MINTGTRNAREQSIYPKKEGIFTPFSSEMDFTIKFGAFPMYVLAPINTAPQEIAESSFAGTVPRDVAIPLVIPRVPAVVRNTR